MPAIKVITPILGGRYYHIFNRGNNGQQVFFSEENYKYFLQQFYQFLYPCVDLLAYSLMSNHFHFLIKTKDSITVSKATGIPSFKRDGILAVKSMDSISLCIDEIALIGTNPVFPEKMESLASTDSISFPKDGILITNEAETGKIISNQFRRFFITYSMAINHQEKRTGSLFSKTFKRLEIEDEDYLRYVAFYIHYNPQKHGWIDDFRNYRYSSWKAYNSNKATSLNRELLIDLFGGIDEFHEYHRYFHEEKDLNLLE